MPPLKDGKGWCFTHSPEAAGRRSAARAKGGKRRHEVARQPREGTNGSTAVPPGAPPPVPFQLGELRTSDQVADAAVAVARAIADGGLDIGRARLLLSALDRAREALVRREDRVDDPRGDPQGAREATDAELDYCIANGGRLPAGLSFAIPPRIRVFGPPWHGDPKPDPGERQDGDAKIIEFPARGGAA